MKIIILNIQRNVEEEELQQLFTPFGAIDSCIIVMDDKTNISKGFGFIEMPNADEANKAIAELHGYKLGNQKIRVKEAKEDKKVTEN